MTEKKQKVTLLYPVSPPYETVYRSGYVPYPVKPHAHNAIEIYFTLNTLPDVLLGDKVSEVSARSLIIIPPFCIHRLYHEKDKEYSRYILSVNSYWFNKATCGSSRLPDCFSENGRPRILSPTSNECKLLIEGFEELLAYQSSTTSPQALGSFFRLLSLFDGLYGKEEYPPTLSDSMKRVNEILTYIQEHIHEKTGLSELSKTFHLNPDYLSRLFKKHMHIPPGRYIMLQKISAAEALLREGQSVPEVQELLGFSSYEYFFKCFKKETGLSPSMYRKNLL